MKRPRSPTPPMPEHLRFGVMSVPFMMMAQTFSRTTAEFRAPVESESEVVFQATARIVPMSTAEAEANSARVAAEETRAAAKQIRAARIESQKVELAAATEKYELEYMEELLVRGCNSVVDLNVEQVAKMCIEARITPEDVELHGSEVGVEENLRPDMIVNILKFVQFMNLMEKLDIIQFKEAIPGRTLLGYNTIKIKKGEDWEAIVCSVCGFGNYFRAFSTLYEMVLKFGFGMSREGSIPAHGVLGNSTQNKTNALLYCQTMRFDERKLDTNLKRYTNQQMKPKQSFVEMHVLAKVATKLSK